MTINIDGHIKKMMIENTIAKEMFIACMLKMAGKKNITPKSMKNYTLAQQGVTENGISKVIYRFEYTPRKKRKVEKSK